MIHFDEATHTYWLQDRRLPSVTEVLKPLYGDLRFVDQDLLDYKSDLGRAVHKAIELHVLDGLDYSTLDDLVAQYFSQYLHFEWETGFKATASEQIVHHSMGYAGMLDLAGSLGDTHAVIDAKTTAALSKAVALQLAAYRAAYMDWGYEGPSVKRFALRLTPHSYHLQPYLSSRDAADFAAFMGFLKVHQWCSAVGATFTPENVSNG